MISPLSPWALSAYLQPLIKTKPRQAAVEERRFRSITLPPVEPGKLNLVSRRAICNVLALQNYWPGESLFWEWYSGRCANPLWYLSGMQKEVIDGVNGSHHVVRTSAKDNRCVCPIPGRRSVQLRPLWGLSSPSGFGARTLISGRGRAYRTDGKDIFSVKFAPTLRCADNGIAECRANPVALIGSTEI